MPRIGMRMVKSAVAVFICFVLSMLRSGSMPFYSAIAAVLCMQPFVPNSIKVAVNRLIGTLLGGLFGMLMLAVFQRFLSDDTLLRYLIISLSLIALLYLSVLLKKPSAGYITCVVFMSITVVHVVDTSPWLFGINRMIDTVLGIGVSLLVNMARLPRRKNRNILFACSLDALCENGVLTTFTRVHLTRLERQGAQIALLTGSEPAVVLPLLQDVCFHLPLTALDGAVQVDLRTKTYLRTWPLPDRSLAAAYTAAREAGLAFSADTVQNEHLATYYDDPAASTGLSADELYRRHYILAPPPQELACVRATAYGAPEQLDALRGKLRQDPAVRAGLPVQKKGYARCAFFSAQAGFEQAVCTMAGHERLTRIIWVGPAFAGLALKREEPYVCQTGDRAIRSLRRLFHARKTAQGNKGGNTHAAHVGR